MNITTEYCALGALESVDPAVFLPGPDCSKDVCAFILALAEFYNDIKDVLMADVLLNSERPVDLTSISRARGAFSGIYFHIFKVQVGMLHELLYTIGNVPDTTFESAIMRRTISKLSATARTNWEELVSVARGNASTSTFGQTLHSVRNKISFHYDPKAIARGYEWHFVSGQRRDDRAYISRGTSMRETRFFFADAASHGYVKAKLQTEIIEDFVNATRLLTTQVNRATEEIVIKFIQERGYAFRAFTEAVD